MMHSPTAGHSDPIDRGLKWSALVVLALALITGGDSIGHDWGDSATQLAALPVLFLAMLVLTRAPLAPARSVAAVLAFLGPVAIIAQLALGTTLTPWASERALLGWIPPLAIFLAGLAVSGRTQRQGAGLIIGMVGLSLLLAMLQLSAPKEALFNPFPEWVPEFNGLFANPNHQATALYIAAILLLTWPVDRDRPKPRDHALRVMRIGLAVLFLVAIPLTTSRAMILIAVGALLILPWANGWVSRQLHRHGGSRRIVLLGLGGGLALVAAMVISFGWLQVADVDRYRATMRDVTAALAWDAMPWGTGAGSFVREFNAHLPDALLTPYYFNHAHNEYLQWWLEGGVAGLAWIALLGFGLWWTSPRRAHGESRPDPSWVGAWLGLLCLLAHSAVDYPLRTPALACVAAWLAASVLRHAADCHVSMCSGSRPRDNGKPETRALDSHTFGSLQ